MSTVGNSMTAGAATLFLARTAAALEQLELDGAKSDLDSAQSEQKEIRERIKDHEAVRDDKQADLNQHLDQGPGMFQRLTGIGNHDAVTNQKKADVEITEADIEKEEAKLKKEREEIDQALDTVREALSAAAGTRQDIVTMLDDETRIAQRIMRG